MKIGAAQWDITPKPGVELCGFVNREQPSIGIQDSLQARALYFEQDSQRLLWINVDLLGWPREFVKDFRAWAEGELGLKPEEVLLSATHTHGAPGVLRLLGCGRLEEEYEVSLRLRLEDLAHEAKESPRLCRVVFASDNLELAVDRRHKPTALTDPRLTALGWRALDGPFIAAAAIYSMHPVAMGASRLITADWPGRAAAFIQNRLPGNPTTMISSGASGNLNTPVCGTSEFNMRAWADRIGETVVRLLTDAEPPLEPAVFRVASKIVPLPVDAWGEAEIKQWSAEKLEGITGTRPQDNRYRKVLETWRDNRLRELALPGRDAIEAELFAVRFGPVVLLGVNAEVFCQFAVRLRKESGRETAVMGGCNGTFGYLPHKEAYDEGGYEPNSSFLFYDHLRVRGGSLEFLADKAVELVGSLYADE